MVAGDSAGGNLAAAVAIATREKAHAPIGQVLIYPGLGGHALGLPSYTEHANAVHLTAADVGYYVELRAGGPAPDNDPTFAPLAAIDFSNVASCFAVSADIDPLRDDAKLYAERLRAAGVAAISVNEPGLLHGYLRARHMSARARQSFARITHAISRLGQGLPLF